MTSEVEVAMLAELRAIRKLLEATGQNRFHSPQVSAPNDKHTRLLRAVAEAVAETAFSAAEVLQHSRLVPPLHQALEAAGVRNPRRLGKWCRRTEGTDVAGLRLVRIGQDRDGIVWRVWRV